MTIAFDAVSAGSSSGTTALTVAHTCTGSDLALVVSAACPNSTNYLATGTATYNGVSMGSPRVSNITGGSLFLYTWVLANPDAGTHNIVVTPSANAYLNVIGISFSGVDQTTPVDATANRSNGFSTSPFSDAISVSSGGVAVDAFVERLLTGTLACDGSQTNAITVTANSVSRMGASYKTDATAMAWTFSATQPVCAHTVVALKAAAAGGPSDQTLTPSLFTNTNAFYAPTVSVSGGPQTLTPGLFTNTSTFFAPTVSWNQTLTPGLFSNSNAFYGPTVVRTPGFLTPVMKNNTGAVWANETGITCNVYNQSTGALVLHKTGLTADANGVVSVTDNAMVKGTTYDYNIKLGTAQRLPTAVA